MKRSVVAVLFAIPGLLAAQNPPASSWRLDVAHSNISFRVRHMGLEWVNGIFTNFSGSFVYDPARPESASVTITIVTSSVSTQNERRDNDLKANYLNVDSFPNMTFTSRRVEKVDSTHLRVTGDLTIRGTTRPVVLATGILGLSNGQRGKRTSFTATTQIKREDFGLTRNAILEGVQVVGSDVYITIDFTANQPPASP